MQLNQVLKIFHNRPKITLHSKEYGVQSHITVNAENQLEHNGVPFSNLKTIKLTIGAPGVEDCDFNLVSAANQTEQVIDLGAVIPALARVIDIKTHTSEAFTAGATTLVAEVGNTASGAQFIASGTILAANAIRAMANAGALAVAPSATASHVYVAITPGANWAGIVAGKLDVYITYLETV